MTTLDGKLLYAVRAGRLLTINSDNAKLVKTDQVVIQPKNQRQGLIQDRGGAQGGARENQNWVSNQDKVLEDMMGGYDARRVQAQPTVPAQNGNARQEVPRDQEGAVREEVPQNNVEEVAPQVEAPRIQDHPENLHVPERAPEVRREKPKACLSKFGKSETDKGNWCDPCHRKKKCKYIIQAQEQVEEAREQVEEAEGIEEPVEAGNVEEEQLLQESGEEEETFVVKNISKNDAITFLCDGVKSEGRALARAGKEGGLYSNWWRIKDSSTKHIRVLNMDVLKQVKVKSRSAEVPNHIEEDDEDVDTFVLLIPRYLHGEKRCLDAKMEELEKFVEFDVYEEVLYTGQKLLGTHWVMVEKCKDGVAMVKARLTVRGDQEDTDEIRKDSPTVRKGNVKLVIMISTFLNWSIKTSDVRAAFLQALPLDRAVFVNPPKEKWIPGVVWQLKKPCYGLADASPGFHLSLSSQLTRLGCKMNNLDPAMYVFYKKPTEKDQEVKVPSGLAVSHVDDLLHTGERCFDNKVINPLKVALKFGTEEENEFRYIGMNVIQNEEVTSVDFDHYVATLEAPEIKDISMDADGIMDEDGQSIFKSVVAKITTMGYQCRPDVVYEAKALNSFYKKATLQHFKLAEKLLLKVKAGPSIIKFPRLGSISSWVIMAHGDAGVKSMPVKQTSVGGSVVIICDRTNNRACVVSWRARRLKRKVASSTAGEAMATLDTIGEVVYLKAVLKEIFGTQVENIPVVIASDSQNVCKAVYSTSQIEEAWSIVHRII